MAEDCEDKKKESLRHLAGEQAFELKLIKHKKRKGEAVGKTCKKIGGVYGR